MQMCVSLKSMCEDLAETPALSSAFCAGLSEQQSQEFCTDGTVMYMSGFSWEFDGNVCPVLLLPAWTLKTRLRYYVGLGLVVLMGFGSEALAYLRRTTAAGGGALSCCGDTVADSVRLRRGLDSVLHVMQIGTGYCLMLVAMTYHVPLFACVLVGLGLGHWYFAHQEVAGQTSAFGERPEPCCPDTLPIAPLSTQHGSIQNQSAVGDSLEAVLLATSPGTSNTALDLAAQVKLQVDGMTCNACVKRVQNALHTVEAIGFFDVTLGPPGKVDIVLKNGLSDVDSSSVAQEAIAAIEGTGFSARLMASGAE